MTATPNFAPYAFGGLDAVKGVAQGARYTGAGLVLFGTITGNPVIAGIGAILSAAGSATEFGAKAAPVLDRAFARAF